MEAIYTLSFILSFIMLFVMILQYYKKISAYYVMLFIGIVFFCFGHLILAESDNLSVAIVGKMVMYLGAAFTPFFIMMCIADLCKINIRTITQFIFVLWGSLVFGASTTIGKSQWYYKNISLEKYRGVSVMVKEYGSLHALYPLLLIVCTVLSLIFIGKSFRAKRQVSYISSILMLVMMLISISVYVIERILGIHFELLPAAYVFGELVILILLERISMYDVVSITADSFQESTDYGFVLFNAKGVYYGSDDAAKEWFPELTELRIDNRIKEANTDFIEQIVRWIEGVDKGNVAYFERDDKIIKAEYFVNKCLHGKNRYCIYLLDDTKQQKYTKLMEEYNENLSSEVKARTEKIRAMSKDMLLDMAMIVASRDTNTGGHIRRTGDVVNIFVRELQESKKYVELTPRRINAILNAAILHDFGKIAVGDDVLNKKGKFEDWEYEIMKTHAAKGAELVGEMIKHMDDETFKSVAVNVCHYHHERWDGNGYPAKLSGEDIPFEARVMALADVFDALVSKRVYKARMSYQDAFKIIKEGAGTQFDPVLCEEFLKCREKIEDLYDSYGDDDEDE